MTEREDIRDLNQLKIPLAEVRMWIVEQMREGRTDYPLGDLLYEVRRIYREKQGELQSLDPLDKA